MTGFRHNPLLMLPALLAWVALCLPWQVCHCECHEAVVSTLLSDSCHGTLSATSHGHAHVDPAPVDHRCAGGSHGCAVCEVLDEGCEHEPLVIPLALQQQALDCETPDLPIAHATPLLNSWPDVARQAGVCGTGPPGGSRLWLREIRSVLQLL